MNVMEKGRLMLPLAPGKAEPSDKSELVTEVLFGESYAVLDRNGSWLLVRTDHDGYECWIDHKLHSSDDHIDWRWSRNCAKSTRLILENGQSVLLPFSCLIPEQNNWVWHGQVFQLQKSEPVSRELRSLCDAFIMAPYRWGGRTCFGIDCSGFVQNVFQGLGLELPRDAWQQAEKGELVPFVDQAIDGDLAFFENQEGRITHVGIVLKKEDGSNSIIHASGHVRVDALDHEGIFRRETNTYSHHLRLIRRIR